jgi:hypothetical protein
MNYGTSIAWTSGLLLTALAASACSGPSASAGGAPGAAATASSEQARASAPAQPGKKNACALVDRAQLEGIAGVKLTLLHDIEEEDKTTCELRDASGEPVLVYVTVQWKGGKDQARAEQAALSMAKQALNTGDVDIAELTGSGKVRGLADKAFYSDIMPSWFLKGDVLVQVISPTWPHDKTLATFKAVAASALPRL